jgi:lysophospholipase L1-like esterase
LAAISNLSGTGRVRRTTTLLLLGVQVILLTATTVSWWTSWNNTLFSNGRWILGKDTGKYVFYTFEYMFQPLQPPGLDLTRYMGYQEILYREADGPHRELTGLDLQVRIGQRGYLWVELHKEGPGMLGVRISRLANYPDGFYHYNEKGDLAAYQPFVKEYQWPVHQWKRLKIELAEGGWEVRLGEEFLGSFPYDGSRGGRFGFRGSGLPNTPVYIKDVGMDFRDPGDPGRSWTEREDFDPGNPSNTVILFSLLFSGGLLTLRLLKRSILQAYLSPEKRGTYSLYDDLSLTLLLLVLMFLPPHPSGLWIPGVVLLSEIAALLFLAWSTRGRDPHFDARPYLSGLSLMLILALMGGVTSARHGQWLGRAERSGPMMLKNVNHRAVQITPAVERSSPPLISDLPVFITPGSPFFSGEKIYREQVITAEFTMPKPCTMDVVFQQSSFRTRGDPEGEALPFQRRLLRLSTLKKVPTGLAVGTKNSPAPFRKIKVRPRPDMTNRLELRSDDSGILLTLNGEERRFPGVRPLGFGETGFMVHEEQVTLHNVRIEPISVMAVRENIRSWAFMLLPLILAGLAWLLLRAGGPVAFRDAAFLEFAALYPLAVYFLGSLFPGTETLAMMGRDRMAWLDLLAAAAMLSHIGPVLILKPRIRHAALLFNLCLLAFLIAILTFAWDRLPDNHALRLKFTDEAIAPGELIREKRVGAGPWYASNRLIGANIYVWRQELGGEKITQSKSPGRQRIMVVGGSQAWGSGAASSGETFAELLEKRLQAKGLPVEVFNASVNGIGLGRVVVLYRELLRRFQPDILIVDIGLNDSSAFNRVRGTENQLKTILYHSEKYHELIEHCRKDSTDLLLVLEPMSAETFLRPKRKMYENLQRISLEKGISLVKPAPVMEEMEKDHLVWWDTAHLTPYGHRLMADLIEPELERLVRARLIPSP